MMRRFLWTALFLAVSAPAQAPGGATLEDAAVDESSGVAASRLTPGVYWTHNDSGDGPYLYAFDVRGRSYGRWTVPGARNIDWEDIAMGPGPRAGLPYLYIGDIGDNGRKREDVAVYRVAEPKTGEPGACKPAAECRTARPAVFRLQYPDGPHNAEALLVHPRSGDLYILSKSTGPDTETRVYKARARDLKAPSVHLKRIATLDIPEPLFRTFIGGITGGDIAPDGRHIVLCDYFRMYEASLPEGAPFDDIWKQTFTPTTIGLGLQVEGVAYRLDGKEVIATSEGKPCPLFEIPARD